MHTIVISTTNQEVRFFPQNPEDRYDVMRDLQQVLSRVSRDSILVS